MHERSAFQSMHSYEALDGPLRIHEEEMRSNGAHHHLHDVRKVKYVQYFVGTTCSVDATLMNVRRSFRRECGSQLLTRFPNYHPAPRRAPRGMAILYQNSARFGQ